MASTLRGVRRPSVAPRERGRAASKDVKSEGCGCEATLELLAAEGGPHARAVLQSKHTDVRFFTPRDWALHMHEEEAILGRLTVQGRFSRSAYQQILDEHQVLRRALRRHGRVDPGFARRHARFEDKAVAAMLRRTRTR
jgi:hypothetical protein